MPQHLRLQKFGTMSDSKCSHGCPSIRNSALRSTRIMMVMVLVQLMMILLFSPCVVTAKCATATTTRTRTSLFPLQVLPIPTFAHPESNLTVLVQPPTKRGRPLPPRAAYLLTTTESFTVVVPEYDNGSSSSNSSSSNSSNNSNSKLERTSVQAGNRHCTYASNGGPFSRDGSCVGAVVANGRTVVGEFGAGAVGFGVAYYSVSPRRRRRRPSSLRRQQEEEEDGNDDDGDDRELVWVVGAIESAAQAAGLGLRHFVTGFDWLVYDGKAVASAFNNTTGAEEAPRTAVGVNQQGKLMLLVADGCELCLQRKGLTLNGMADLLVREGAQYAINLDGGGSSVMVAAAAQQNQTHHHHAVVVSRPTCLDLPFPTCERPVASVVCIRHSSNNNIRQRQQQQQQQY